jgi:glucosamine--fructose-6-phosphate aminotransferase (isomerizing)
VEYINIYHGVRMCGIIGYTGKKNARSIIIPALKRLEYRGYDSAGIAVINDEIQLYKMKGELEHLERILPKLEGNIGIGHTRWATHGQPIKKNAHPFLDCKKKTALVHNGIIENYMELKEELMKEGHVFTSETDTEVLVHLIEKYYKRNLEDAVRKALKDIQGSYAIVVIHLGNKKEIVAARNESPLILGVGDGENFVASDIPAILEHTDKVIYMMNREIATLTEDNIKITTLDGKEITREWERVDWSLEDAEKGGYEHFMLKEIFEQPSAIHRTLLGRILDMDETNFLKNHFDSIKIIACGTSYHAGLIGKYLFERIAKVPTTAEMSSEYRHSSPSFENPLVILISQSGETADTLGAAREAKHRGYRTIAVTNVVGSSITREVDEVIYTRAGPEIGVAATKSFITQLVALYIIAINLGLAKKTLTYDDAKHIKEGLRSLPRYAQSVLDNADMIKEVAKNICHAKDVFFIGRNIGFPTALEGALKLKEISYIHAEGYPAGELKHGPLALLTKETPVIAIAVKDHTYQKMLSNIGEVAARGSPTIAVGYESDEDLRKYVDSVIYVPTIENLFAPIPISIALQLLAYYVAKERNCPIDKPRNLAKSVTVE